MAIRSLEARAHECSGVSTRAGALYVFYRGVLLLRLGASKYNDTHISDLHAGKSRYRSLSSLSGLS